MTLSGHTNYVYGLAFSSDHSYLASCSWDSYLNIWSAKTSWSLKNHLFNNGECYDLAQLPNGQLAASSGFNINIWSPTALIKTLTGHIFFGLAVSPDGSLLASGSEDWTVKLWNYKPNSQTTALMTFTGHTNWVKAVCFVSNQILASGSRDATIKIWDVSSGKSEYIVYYFNEYKLGLFI